MPVIATRPAITPATPYRPWTYRTIGVELEFLRDGSITGTGINRALRHAMDTVPGGGHPVQGNGSQYHHSAGGTWDVKRDGSCGWEVSTPALYLDDAGHNAELKAGVLALAAMNARVDETCGLHVWVDCSDFDAEDLRRLIALWVRYEPFFFSIQPRERWANRYCQALRQSTWTGSTSSKWETAQRAIQAGTSSHLRTWCQELEKYCSLKTEDWWVHGRVEFRLGAGTLDYETVRCWSMLLLAVVERARNHREGWTAIPVTVPSQRDIGYGFTYAHMFKLLGVKSDSRRLNEQTVAPEATPMRDWARTRILQHAMPTLAANGVSTPSSRPHRVRTRPAPSTSSSQDTL
jgi:hypothetical protein